MANGHYGEDLGNAKISYCTAGNLIKGSVLPSKTILNQAVYLSISTEHKPRKPNDIKQI